MPSVDTTRSPGQVAIPDSASVQVKRTVTGWAYQPAPLPLSSAAALMVGAVRSMRTGPWVVEAVLPALSTAVPGTSVPLVSAASDTGAVQVCTPESPSAQAKLTVTVELFQPATGGGDWLAAMVGLVRSRPATT